MGRVVHLYPEEESECGSSGGTLLGGTLTCTHFWAHGRTGLHVLCVHSEAVMWYLWTKTAHKEKEGKSKLTIKQK